MAKGRTARYYARNPKARAKKKAYDKKYNKKRSAVKKRVEANRKRREAKRNGKNVQGKDYDHSTGRFVKSSVNRGRKGEGGRKKGSKRRKRK